MWELVGNDEIRHIWRCPECDETETIQPDFYEESGTPMCSDCDCDLRFSHSEIDTAGKVISYLLKTSN